METIRNVDVDAINHKIYILFMELLDKIEQGYYEDYQDILDLISYSKNQMQADLAEIMMSIQEKISSSEEPEEEDFEERRDVS